MKTAREQAKVRALGSTGQLISASGRTESATAKVHTLSLTVLLMMDSGSLTKSKVLEL